MSKLSLDGKPKSTLVLAVNHRLWLYVHAQRTVQSARNQVRDRKTQSASLTMSYIRRTLRAWRTFVTIINNAASILAFVLHVKRAAINITRSGTRSIMNLSIVAHLLY